MSPTLTEAEPAHAHDHGGPHHHHHGPALSHSHHHHGAAAADNASAPPPFSLIRASLALRLAGAVIISGLIWLAVYLVLAVPA
jgi:ABC-type nickel/cobalt efflux system permease component RcnA